MAENMKDWALMYAGLGFAVFPLRPRDKRPATENGFKTATTDKQRISDWWDKYPDCNIGIATGSMSGGLVVIDLDIDEDKGINGYETLNQWQQEHGTLPDTWQSITGRGGYHLFYKDIARNKSRANLYEGVDIRADGGYIVAPPSIHPNGRRYEWEQGPGDDIEIAEVDSRSAEFLLGDLPDGWAKKGFQEPESIPEGGRVKTMIQLIGSLRGKGLGNDAIKAAVQEENSKKCVPPLTDQELEKEVFPALKRDWKTERPYTAVPDQGGARPMKKREKLSLVCLSDIEEEEVTWLFHPYIPRGKVTLCAAYPGTGKTYLLCYMGACVSTGRSFFNLVPFSSEPGKVIYLTAEDGIGDTIKKRMRVCGANMENIATVLNKKTQLLFDDPEIEEYMRGFKPDLMIFDPFQAYIGSDIDMNAPNKTSEKMGHLVELAEKYDVAVVIICHFNKNGKGDAITRVLGSTDIMGSCRSYLALGNVPGEDDMKFMSHEKSSLAKKGKTILFEIDPDRGGIVYLGENSLSMDDYTAIRNKKRARDAPAVEGAKQFLVNNMPEGRRLAQELKNLATANKISESSLKRARTELGIISEKEKAFPFRSIWVLPGHAEEEPEVAQETLDLPLDQAL